MGKPRKKGKARKRDREKRTSTPPSDVVDFYEWVERFVDRSVSPEGVPYPWVSPGEIKHAREVLERWRWGAFGDESEREFFSQYARGLSPDGTEG